MITFQDQTGIRSKWLSGQWMLRRIIRLKWVSLPWTGLCLWVCKPHWPGWMRILQTSWHVVWRLILFPFTCRFSAHISEYSSFSTAPRDALWWGVRRRAAKQIQSWAKSNFQRKLWREEKRMIRIHMAAKAEVKEEQWNVCRSVPLWAPWMVRNTFLTSRVSVCETKKLMSCVRLDWNGLFKPWILRPRLSWIVWMKRHQTDQRGAAAADLSSRNTLHVIMRINNNNLANRKIWQPCLRQPLQMNINGHNRFKNYVRIKRGPKKETQMCHYFDI